MAADFPDPERLQGAASIEARLETLADEMGRLIESGPRNEREALHDFAVSLIRDRAQSNAVVDAGAPVGMVEEQIDAGVGESSGSNAAMLIGYGCLLVPVAFVLTPVLPPIGVMLGLTSVAMVVSGACVALISRVRTLFASST